MSPNQTINLWLDQVPSPSLTQSRKRLHDMTDSNDQSQPQTKTRKTDEFDDEVRYYLPRSSFTASREASQKLPPSAGSKSKRSESETSKEDIVYSVQSYAIGNTQLLPVSLRDLATVMRRTERGTHVLPGYCRAWPDKWQFETGDAEVDEEIFDIIHGTREGLGKIPRMDDMCKLLGRSIRDESKVGLKGVHYSMLHHAQRGLAWKKDVRWDQVETAQITHPELDMINDRSHVPKADFCIAVELRTSIPNLSKLLYQSGTTHLNHREYTTTRPNPIAIGMRTTASHEGSRYATAQLTNWAVAQVDFLRYVLESSNQSTVEIPALPLIMVEGHQWYMYYFIDDKVSAKLYNSRNAAFGNTDTLLGLYKIIAGLQHLMQWAHVVYRPWFEKYILAPLIENQVCDLDDAKSNSNQSTKDLARTAKMLART